MSRFRYPRSLDDSQVLPHIGAQFREVHRLHGAGDPRALFPEGSSALRPAPWPRAPRSKVRQSYNKEIVAQELRSPASLKEVDPRQLHATQPSIRHEALAHYMEDDFNRSGIPYADKANIGNKFPLVYEREDGINMLLSGHHRAAAALLKGEPLRARRVQGPWGDPR